MISAERQIRRIRYDYLRCRAEKIQKLHDHCFFRFRLFRNILYQDMTYFDLLGNKGKLISALNDDLIKMKDGIGDRVADFLSLLARMIGCLVFALITGWKLTMVILSVAPLVILAFNLTIHFTVKYSKAQIDAYAEVNSIVQEVLHAIRTVTAFNGQKKEYERLDRSDRSDLMVDSEMMLDTKIA